MAARRRIAMTETYRLKTAALAILEKNGKADAIVIPGGAAITVTEPQTEDRDGVIQCAWAGFVVMIRACDLRERGARVVESGS
jgi:hypothetical protein